MEITIERLTKVYGGKVKALDSVDLEIPTGMFGLLGPNGAGKTTLMRILAGILRPTSGSARVGGNDLSTEAGRLAVKRALGYLPQELGLYPDLSAHEFLDYIGILKGLEDKQTRRRRIEELLDVVGLRDVSKRKLKGFSGGMKRRVGIAQALLNDPRLLIVDEPTAGLDPEERIRFRNLLSDLGGNRTVLLSTHIVEDVAQTSRNLAVMNKGTVLYQGTAADLIRASQDKVWTIETEGPKPDGGLTVVSTLHLGDSVQYRVVGEPSANLNAKPTPPSLEDGYVWLMRENRVVEAA
ncbi:ATP-binding cassette domain-containing protein [Rubrobacter tropicus]|uniref:ATP-binding cassette domain-containing protein n=1 Tax=Rubrobacter tropicus TaxID=2653851 RepID=A0A6G8QDE7_9ACTN|nr:ABC transporter ATP-binding protein [Rubrobacter tropicus]QIN84530.1 ATP-binding cassette domain-containing protein [Rubrobacter tropicus]